MADRHAPEEEGEVSKAIDAGAFLLFIAALWVIAEVGAIAGF